MKEYSVMIRIGCGINAKNVDQAKERAEEIADALAIVDKYRKRYFPDEIIVEEVDVTEQ